MTIPASLFRRHVGGRAQQLAFNGHGNLACLTTGQAKVHDVWPALVIQHDVGRLQVTVDHASLVSVMQSLSDRDAQSSRFTSRQLLSGQPVGQRQSLDEIADDVQRVVLASNLVHRDDVRMPQLSSRASLSQEVLRLGFTELVFAGNLDGHRTVEFGVESLPDAAERSLAQTVNQFEMTDGLRVRPIVCDRLTVTRQIESAPAGLTRHVSGRIVTDQFNRLMAVGAANLHGRGS